MGISAHEDNHQGTDLSDMHLLQMLGGKSWVAWSTAHTGPYSENHEPTFHPDIGESSPYLFIQHQSGIDPNGCLKFSCALWFQGYPCCTVSWKLRRPGFFFIHGSIDYSPRTNCTFVVHSAVVPATVDACRRWFWHVSGWSLHVSWISLFLVNQIPTDQWLQVPHASITAYLFLGRF